MTTKQETVLQNSLLARFRFDKVALIMSIIAFLCFAYPVSIWAGFWGAKFANDYLLPIIGICFPIFFSFVPISTILGLVNLMQEGVKHRLAMVALTLNGTAIAIAYILETINN